MSFEVIGLLLALYQTVRTDLPAVFQRLERVVQKRSIQVQARELIELANGLDATTKSHFLKLVTSNSDLAGHLQEAASREDFERALGPIRLMFDTAEDRAQIEAWATSLSDAVFSAEATKAERVINAGVMDTLEELRAFRREFNLSVKTPQGKSFQEQFVALAELGVESINAQGRGLEVHVRRDAPPTTLLADRAVRQKIEDAITAQRELKLVFGEDNFNVSGTAGAIIAALGAQNVASMTLIPPPNSHEEPVVLTIAGKKFKLPAVTIHSSEKSKTEVYIGDRQKAYLSIVFGTVTDEQQEINFHIGVLIAREAVYVRDDLPMLRGLEQLCKVKKFNLKPVRLEKGIDLDLEKGIRDPTGAQKIANMMFRARFCQLYIEAGDFLFENGIVPQALPFPDPSTDDTDMIYETLERVVACFGFQKATLDMTMRVVPDIERFNDEHSQSIALAGKTKGVFVARRMLSLQEEPAFIEQFTLTNPTISYEHEGEPVEGETLEEVMLKIGGVPTVVIHKKTAHLSYHAIDDDAESQSMN